MKHLSILLILLVCFSCSNDNGSSDAYGNFESEEVIVSSEGNGKILRLEIDAGDRVIADQALGYIDTLQLVLQKQKLQYQIEAVKAKMQDIPTQILVFDEQEKVLQKEIDRIKSLLADGAATQKQLDDLEGQLEVITRQKAATESQLTTGNGGLLSEIRPLLAQMDILQDQIKKSVIRSPIDGTVLVRYKKAGEVALFGQPLFKLAELDDILLRVYIAGDQLGQVKLGQTAEVSVDLPGQEMKTYSGRVTWIADEAEFTPKIIQTKEARVNLVYAVKILVSNDGGLKIGMPAEVNFK